MTIKNQSFYLLVSLFLILSLLNLTQASSYFFSITGGTWTLLQENLGISAMHMQVLRNNKVLMFDRTDFGRSNLSLPTGSTCRSNDEAVKPKDCTAHSVLYDIPTNSFRPLTVQTNTFCSSGSLDRNGKLVQTGGDRDGERVIRTFTTCDEETTTTPCDWVELNTTYLLNRRWYSTDQLLPDGRIIILGGRRVFTYEFYPKSSSKWDNFTLPFLVQTRDPKEENNLYPFLHLLPDGNLFIFANNRSILFDYQNNNVVKEFPVIPGGDRRNYPSTGSSVLLPLKMTDPGVLMQPEAEVMVCGGASAGSYIKATYKKLYVEASRTCGRLKVSNPNPQWVMEVMPIPRVMNDMLLLPTGDVILINGARKGTAGWNNARDPVCSPVIYLPEEYPTRRFVVLSAADIPRMYHSTAVLLPDGRILVGGSNPHRTYNFTGYPYPTELTLQAFSPHYLDPQYAHLKPSILTVESSKVSYKVPFSVTIALSLLRVEGAVSMVLVAPSFTTHSQAMSQRMVVLFVVGVNQRLSSFAYKITAVGPTSVNVAPPGYYMLFVVHAGIPSHAVWVQVK